MELEFRESMSHRLEKGYILPGQADPSVRLRADGFLSERPAHGVAFRDGYEEQPGHALKRFDMNVKSMSPYNNSFEALTADLKRYKKNGSRVLLLSPSGPGRSGLGGSAGGGAFQLLQRGRGPRGAAGRWSCFTAM